MARQTWYPVIEPLQIEAVADHETYTDAGMHTGATSPAIATVSGQSGQHTTFEVAETPQSGTIW